LTKKEKDPKAVAIGRKSKRKGRKWEQDIARMLRPIFGEDVYRGHQDKRGGAGAGEGADIEGTPFYIECRHEKTYNWRRHLRETLAKRTEREDDRPVILVAKDDTKPPNWRIGQPGTPPLAIMQLEEFLELLKKIYGCKPTEK
jgi:hypothetical protein